MNKTKTNFKVVIITVAVFFAFAMTACETEGCTDPLSENFDASATTDDGSCTYARTKFLGSYNVSETCGSGNFSYTISVGTSTTGADKVVINNFGGYGSSLVASVSGSNITFNESLNISGGNVNFSGSGSIVGNTFTIIYTAAQGTASDNCTKTCVKQ